jgi:hypothetical protein
MSLDPSLELDSDPSPELDPDPSLELGCILV